MISIHFLKATSNTTSIFSSFLYLVQKLLLYLWGYTAAVAQTTRHWLYCRQHRQQCINRSCSIYPVQLLLCCVKLNILVFLKKKLSFLVHSMVSEGLFHNTQNKIKFALTYKRATCLLHSCMITAPGWCSTKSRPQHSKSCNISETKSSYCSRAVWDRNVVSF